MRLKPSFGLKGSNLSTTFVVIGRASFLLSRGAKKVAGSIAHKEQKRIVLL